MVCLEDGLSKILSIDVVLNIILDIFVKWTVDLPITCFEDIDVFTSNQYFLLILFQQRRSMLYFKMVFLLPICPLPLRLLLHFDHKLFVLVLDHTLVDPPRQHADIQLDQFLIELLVDVQHECISIVVDQLLEASY